MAPRRRKSKNVLPENSTRDERDYDHLSNWCESLANYIKQTQTDVLNLTDKRLGKEEVKSILSVLPDSHVTELNLEYNCLKNSMAELAPLLAKTKVRKLNVSNCGLTKKDVLRLTEVLKDSEITELLVVDNSNLDDAIELNLKEARIFISCLRKFKLTTLIIDSFLNVVPQDEIVLFIQEFLNASITSLDLSWCELSSNNLICLFSNLGHSSLTDLDLSSLKETGGSSGISSKVLQELSRRLVETKIEKLSLCGVGLDNDKLSSLVQGLIGSKVIDLNLQSNSFTNPDFLWTKLQKTQIETLNLSLNQLGKQTYMFADSFRCSSLASLDLCHCGLSDEQGEALVESLRRSKVTKLNVSWNDFGLLTVKKLAESISEINLLDLDISFNKISLEGSFILGRCLKESKLTHISARCLDREHYGPHATMDVSDFLSFLKLTEGSSISHIEVDNYPLSWDLSFACEQTILAKTTFSELELSECNIQDVSDLISVLKFTAITNLNLSHNEIVDVGATILAEWLKETQIRRLNLSSTSICSPGAKALALSLKDTNLLYLDLSGNEIEDDGLEFLAKHAEGSFVTELNVSYNSGRKVLLVDKVLCQNKILVHKLVSVFRQVMPKTNSEELCFNQNCDLDVFVFLQNCMWFYKFIINNPQAINVLLEEKNVSFTREQIFKLMFEEFPRQFSRFVACGIEADVTEHVKLLEKAEAMGLSAVVEELLFNRGAYVLDRERDILHPSAYRLLLKYKQPICSLAIEPRAVIKIIEYFTEHSDVEGAQEVIDLLRCARIS